MAQGETEHPGGESIGFAGHAVSDELSERIRDIISAAEAAAGAVRHEAEQAAQARRRAAEEEARRLLENARRDAEALLAERIRRISELSDTILERGEALLTQVDRAEVIKQEFATLAAVLGETAARLAREAMIALETRPPQAALGQSDAAGAQAEEVKPEEADPEAARAEEPEAESPPGPQAEAPAHAQAEVAAEEPATAEPDGGAGNATRQEAPGADAEAPAAEGSGRESGLRGFGRLRRAVMGPEPQERAEPEQPTEPRPVPAADDDEMLGARLVALQMAVAGGNRGEVAEHLRRSFQLLDVDVILDDVFGSGSDPSKRVVWPSAADA